MQLRSGKYAVQEAHKWKAKKDRHSKNCECNGLEIKCLHNLQKYIWQEVPTSAIDQHTYDDDGKCNLHPLIEEPIPYN